MKTFECILSETKLTGRAAKILLKEGGNAVPGVTRINQDNVESTLNNLYRDINKTLKIKKTDVVVVGSTGKKKSGDSSGDIDVAVSISALMKANGKMDHNSLIDLLYAAGNKLSGGFVAKHPNVVSFAYKIENTDGLQNNKFVQVDFFLTDSLEYSSWAYYAPHYTESELKGVYRNILIGQLLKAISTEITRVESDIPVEQTKIVFDVAKGLVKNWQTKLGKKGILKNWLTINKDIITTKPDEISKLILGDEYTSKDALTFENIVRIVKSPAYKYKNKRADIIKFTKDALTELGLPVPSIL